LGNGRKPGILCILSISATVLFGETIMLNFKVGPRSIDPEGIIKIKKIPSQEVLYTIHKGPCHELGPAYTALHQYASEKGCVPLGCPMEIYLNDPAKVPEKELLTEVQLPVKRK
jgi:effector-binding domain-containing protein